MTLSNHHPSKQSRGYIIRLSLLLLTYIIKTTAISNHHLRRRSLASSSSSTIFTFPRIHVPHHQHTTSSDSPFPSFSSPSPPSLPLFREVPGTEFVQLSEQQDFSFQLYTDQNLSLHQQREGGEENDWCTSPSSSALSAASRGLSSSSTPSALRWTSEDGSIKLNGQTIYLKGINWFGFETANMLPQGLATWTPERFMQFLATHQFNAIRLPFSYEWANNLDLPISHPDQVLPELRGLTQGALLDRILDAASAYGILVLLDFHVITAAEGIDDLWYDTKAGVNLEAVLDVWQALLRRVLNLNLNDETVSGNLNSKRWNVFAIDLKNEPHGVAKWGNTTISSSISKEGGGEREGGVQGDPLIDFRAYAIEAIKFLAQKVPEYQGLFFVEGIEGRPSPSGFGYWWGSNLSGARQAPVTTDDPQLDARVVYSAHIYGPELYPAGYYYDKDFPNNLFGIWDEQFGWVQKVTGRAIVLGEWGGSIVGDHLQANMNQKKLAEWLVANCMTDNFWWCLDPETADGKAMLSKDYQAVDINVLKLLDYVQPRPTRFLVSSTLDSDSNSNSNLNLCIRNGSPADARCVTDNSQSLPIGTIAAVTAVILSILLVIVAVVILHERRKNHRLRQREEEKRKKVTSRCRRDKGRVPPAAASAGRPTLASSSIFSFAREGEEGGEEETSKGRRDRGRVPLAAAAAAAAAVAAAGRSALASSPILSFQREGEEKGEGEGGGRIVVGGREPRMEEGEGEREVGRFVRLM